MIADTLDHFVILVPDATKSVRMYSALLGRSYDAQHETPADGTVTTLYRLENTSIELIAPKGDGPVAARIRDILGDKQGALTSLAFGTSNIGDAHYNAMRRGLKPGDIKRQSTSYMGQARSWSSFRCDDPSLADVKVFIVQQEIGEVPLREMGEASAFRLDHVVVNTGNPDRAMANYGAKLGLRLAMDRTNEKWGARFMFFRAGHLTLEIIRRLQDGLTPDDPDDLWGLTYEAGNLDEARTRMLEAGVEVSEVRTGRKPGTRVMSVKSHDLGIPTLLLDKRADMEN